MNSLKHTARMLIVLSICIFSNAVLAADEGKVSPEERTKVIKLLKDSQAETLAALEKAVATNPDPEARQRAGTLLAQIKRTLDTTRHLPVQTVKLYWRAWSMSR